jgi:hypothetical protein
MTISECLVQRPSCQGRYVCKRALSHPGALKQSPKVAASIAHCALAMTVGSSSAVMCTAGEWVANGMLQSAAPAPHVQDLDAAADEQLRNAVRRR